MNEKKSNPLYGIGTVTLLTVLLILCFTLFSVLALSSAQADRRLTEKNAEMTKAYYLADSRGEETLAALAALENPTADQALAAIDPAYSPQITETEDGLLAELQIPVGETQILSIALVLEETPTVRAWQVLPGSSAGGVQEASPLPVWQGER